LTSVSTVKTGLESVVVNYVSLYGFATSVQSTVLTSINRQKAHTSLIDRHLVHTPETASDVIEVVGRLCRPEILADVIAEVTPRRNKPLVSAICSR